MAKNSIISDESGIIVKENSITLSDEKLKGMLSRTYEHAQKDMNKFKFRNYYSVFLSIAGTLFLSLLTADFGSLGKISSTWVTGLAWTLCIGAAVLGFVLMGLHVSEKTSSDTASRDNAVKSILDEHLLE